MSRPDRPITDPTLGIPVDPGRVGTPRNRLVAIGDSLTQGFGSGAVFHTDLSFPAIIAAELGDTVLRYPTYPGFGGLPFNIELLMRELEERFGTAIDWWEVPLALFHLRGHMDDVEDYWERGPGSAVPTIRTPRHVLAMYGWTLRDALARTAARAFTEVRPPSDDLVNQLVEDNGARAALRMLPNSTVAQRSQTVFDAAAELGEQRGAAAGDDPEHGIETLVMFLGANNALGAVTSLSVRWSAEGYQDLDRLAAFTVWRPEHFAAELALVAEQVCRVRARHVIWCTIPHVTIAPVARGVGTKPSGSRYFPYYTRPWITDDDFDPGRHPHITGAQARDVDAAIDAYNVSIIDTVARARENGRDWYVCDIATLLDRLAVRRYVEDPAARPAGWTPYELPAALRRLDPVPDIRFLTTGPDGRRATGGLFSLDGTHPTIAGYGLVAQEVMGVMEQAGVQFRSPDGTPRPSPVVVDFDRLVRRDALLTDPPANVTSGLQILGWADEAAGLFGNALPF